MVVEGGFLCRSPAVGEPQGPAAHLRAPGEASAESELLHLCEQHLSQPQARQAARPHWDGRRGDSPSWDRKQHRHEMCKANFSVNIYFWDSPPAASSSLKDSLPDSPKDELPRPPPHCGVVSGPSLQLLLREGIIPPSLVSPSLHRCSASTRLLQHDQPCSYVTFGSFLPTLLGPAHLKTEKSIFFNPIRLNSNGGIICDHLWCFSGV